MAISNAALGAGSFRAKGFLGFELSTFTGSVIDEKVWSESHVYGTGGTHTQAANIKTAIRNRREFWLKRQDGMEWSFTLPAERAPLRVGQTVSVIIGRFAGRDYVAGIYNHPMRAFQLVDKAPWRWWMYLLIIWCAWGDIGTVLVLKSILGELLSASAGLPLLVAQAVYLLALNYAVYMIFARRAEASAAASALGKNLASGSAA